MCLSVPVFSPFPLYLKSGPSTWRPVRTQQYSAQAKKPGIFRDVTRHEHIVYSYPFPSSTCHIPCSAKGAIIRIACPSMRTATPLLQTALCVVLQKTLVAKGSRWISWWIMLWWEELVLFLSETSHESPVSVHDKWRKVGKGAATGQGSSTGPRWLQSDSGPIQGQNWFPHVTQWPGEKSEYEDYLFPFGWILTKQFYYS